MTKIKRTDTTKKGTFMSKITFTWTPPDSFTRMKLEHYISELINDGYVTVKVKGMRNTMSGLALSNGSNTFTIYGKSLRIDNIIDDLKEFIPDLQDESQKRVNEGLKYDSSYKSTIEQIVNNLSDDFIDSIVNDFVDFEQKNDKNWFKNYKYVLTDENLKLFFIEVIIEMLSDVDKLEEYILTPAKDNIIVEMDIKKDEFDNYIGLE